jgi:hypothetical protein
MAEWIKREYGKGEIDRAGASLIPWWGGDAPKPANLGSAFIIVQNWRSSHGLPLNVFQAALRSRVKRVEEGAIVAQRLKRFSSVMNKLARESNMKLSQMQDLGGCRAILSSVKEVDRLYGMYRGDEPLHESEAHLKCYDYIRSPKDDGYRGIHIVGRYHPRAASREAWDGQRIEIQLRSRLQHAFATAVETVTTFTRQPLKFGAGPVEWRRFFSLMGSALAIREMTPLVHGTPLDPKELIRELKEASKTLKVRHRLEGWANALRVMPSRSDMPFKWLLLFLDIKKKEFAWNEYASRREATEELDKVEQAKRKDVDAVLVWVPSVTDLRAAYPNYYADTREFLAALKSALSSISRI